MRYLVLLGDGMADWPLDELGGRTPLEAASTPAMDAVAQRGVTGLFNPIPEGMPPGSDVGNLSVFGYDPRSTFTGRAPLEAANQGIALGPGEVAFRCNLVTLADGCMQSFTSDHISSEEAAELIGALNEAYMDAPVTFYPGVSYRHLALIRPNATAPEDLVAAACTPPHDITGREYAPYLPNGAAGGLLKDLMARSRDVLAAHPVNARRRAAGKLPATSIWLWGQGLAPRMPKYRDRFGLTGAVISAVDLVRGIGVCAGLEVLRVEGATGYLDTNYEGKVAAALTALARVDFIYLHVEAPDETAHEGKTDLKIRAIEDFDARVVAPCLEWASREGDCRVLVAPDHITAIATKTHAAGPVPFAVCGAGVESIGAPGYSERSAAGTGVHVAAGHTLLPTIIREPRLGAAAFLSR